MGFFACSFPHFLGFPVKLNTAVLLPLPLGLLAGRGRGEGVEIKTPGRWRPSKDPLLSTKGKNGSYGKYFDYLASLLKVSEGVHISGGRVHIGLSEVISLQHITAG